MNFLNFVSSVLGSDFGWAWCWSKWELPWRFRSAIRENQCLLQWSQW